MTKEQKEYIYTLVDNYNQEVDVLHNQEMSLKDALFAVQERQEVLKKTFEKDISEFMTTALYEQERYFYKKYEDMGISTDGIFFKSTLFISKVIIFFEKIFKKDNTLELERSSS